MRSARRIIDGTHIINTYGYRVIELKMATEQGGWRLVSVSGHKRMKQWMPGENMRGTIAVFGSSRREPNSALYREAYELGRLLAEAGYTVLSGGYNGSMGAVSRGRARGGGPVIGVTCALFDPLPANRWLSEEVKARDLLERLSIMMTRADGFVAVRGGIGTL